MSMALVFSVYGTGIFQKWKIFRTDQLRDLIDRQVSWGPIHPKIRGVGGRGGGPGLRASVLHENKMGTLVAHALYPLLQ